MVMVPWWRYCEPTWCDFADSGTTLRVLSLLPVSTKPSTMPRVHTNISSAMSACIASTSPEAAAIGRMRINCGVCRVLCACRVNEWSWHWY